MRTQHRRTFRRSLALLGTATAAVLAWSAFGHASAPAARAVPAGAALAADPTFAPVDAARAGSVSSSSTGGSSTDTSSGSSSYGSTTGGSSASSSSSGSSSSGSNSSSTSTAPTKPGPDGRKRITPEQFGANGNDDADDTAALQRAFDAVDAKSYVAIPEGKTYRHDKVLRITHDGALVRGGGTILATDENRSAIFADANDVTFENLTIRLTKWTVRKASWDTTGIRGLKHRNLTLRDIRFKELSLYLNNVDGFELTRIRVEHSQADGVHLTGGSRNGRVHRVTTSWTGDDGVAVVSYQGDGKPCENIKISDVKVLGTTNGRGISVIGGNHIAYRNVTVEDSSAAAVIVASEQGWKTWAPRDVVIENVLIKRANHSFPRPDHGAVLVHSSRKDGALGGQPLDNVRISHVRIIDTDKRASADVRVSVDNGATLHRVVLEDFTISGGPSHPLTTSESPKALTVKHWTKDGKKVTARR